MRRVNSPPRILLHEVTNNENLNICNLFTLTTLEEARDLVPFYFSETHTKGLSAGTVAPKSLLSSEIKLKEPLLAVAKDPLPRENRLFDPPNLMPWFSEFFPGFEALAGNDRSKFKGIFTSALLQHMGVSSVNEMKMYSRWSEDLIDISIIEDHFGIDLWKLAKSFNSMVDAAPKTFGKVNKVALLLVSFVLHFKIDVLLLTDFCPRGIMVNPLGLTRFFALSDWHALPYNANKVFPVRMPVKFTLATLLALKFLRVVCGNADATPVKMLSQDPSAVPLRICKCPHLLPALRATIFTKKKVGPIEYYITANEFEEGERAVLPLNTRCQRNASVMFLDIDTAVIFPWHCTYVPSINARTGRVSVSLKSNTSIYFLLFWGTLFWQINGAAAVTEHASSVPKYSIWLLVLISFAQLILKIVGMRENNVEDDEEQVPDLESNRPQLYSLRKPYKKSQDSVTVASTVPEEAKPLTLTERELRLFSIKLRYTASLNSRLSREVINKPDTKPDERMHAAIHHFVNKKQLSSLWVIESASKRHIPMAWVPNDMHSSLQEYMQHNSQDLARHFSRRTWKKDVAKVLDKLRDHVKVKKVQEVSLFPSVNNLTKIADHPVTGLFMFCQRIALTNWTTNTSAVAKASIGLDLTVVLLRVWNIVPKNSRELFSTALSMTFPGWTSQDTGSSTLDTAWMAELTSYDGDWQKTRESTKNIVLKVLAFGATLPILWQSYTSEATWHNRIFSFCAKQKSAHNISHVVDAMFDMFESLCVACGLGRKSACFDEELKVAEAKYAGCVEKYNTVTAGRSDETLFEIAGDMFDALETYKEMRSKCTGLQQERHVTDRINAINLLISRVHSAIDMGEVHYDTKFYLISGDPGVGKTTMIGCLFSLCMALIGQTPRIGHLVEGDEYDSGLTPYQNCLYQDDTGKTAPKYLKSPPGNILIRFGTNAATPLLSPIAEYKNVHHSHHMLGGMTSNLIGGGLFEGMSSRGAIDRRLTQYQMSVDADKSEWNGKNWLPKKEFRKAIPEPTNALFQRVKCDVEDQGQGLNLIVEPEKRTWDEIKIEIKNDFLAHHRHQMVLMNKKLDRTFCCHDTYKMNCEICSECKTQDSAIPDKVRRRVALSFSKWFDGHFSFMIEMEEDERLRNKVDNLFVFFLFSGLVFLSLFVTGATYPGILCTVIAARCFCYAIMYSFADEQAALNLLTADELRETAITDPTMATMPVMGALTLGGALALVAMWRSYGHLRAQDNESSGSKAVEELDPEAVELAKQLQAYKDGENPLITVHELKRQKAKANLVHQMVENYWNSPRQMANLSKAGSGATNETLAAIVGSQLYTQVQWVKTGTTYSLVKRTVWNIRPNYVMMTKHGYDKLRDGEVLQYLQDGFDRRIPLDKKSTLMPSTNRDYVLVYTGVLSGRAKNMLKFMSNNYIDTSANSGIIVYQDYKTNDYKTGSCLLNIRPTKTELINAMSFNPILIKGVVNATLEMRSYDGLCGAMYITNRTIVGMHTFGSSGIIGYNGAGGPLVTKDEVENLFSALPSVPDYDGPKLEYHSMKIPLAEPHPKNPSNFVYTSPVDVYAYVPRTFTPKSEYRENPLCQSYAKCLGMDLEGKFVKPRDSFNKVAGKMINACAASKGSIPKSLMNRAVNLYLKGVEGIVKQAFEQLPILLTRPMTVHEVINGIEGHPYANGIDPTKSAGFGRNHSKMLCLEGEPGSRRLKPAVQRDVDELEGAIARGEATGCVGQVLKKDQPMVPGKDDRGMIGVSLEFQILSMRYLGPIMHVMQFMCHYFCNAIGIDPGSKEWEEFEKRYDICRPACFCSADISWYDLSHCESAKDGDCEVYHRLAKLIGYSGEEADKVARVMHENEHLFINFGGPILFLMSIWGSGMVPTAHGGSVKTILMLICGLLEQWGDVDDVRDHVVMAALGDDNKTGEIGTSPLHIDAPRLARTFTDWGMLLTPDSKVGELALCHRDEVRFLKRETEFHSELGYRVGKLAMESLTRPLVLCKKSPNFHQTMVDITNSMMRECALHGRKVYNLFLETHKEIFTQNEWAQPDVLHVSYDDYIEVLKARIELKDIRPLVTQGEETETEEAEGVREIVEPGTMEPEEDADLSTWRDPSIARMSSPEKALPPYIQREVFISTVQLTYDTFASISLNPLEEILGTKGIAERLATYHAIACDVVVRVALSGTKFDYGEFIMSYMYSPDLLDYQNEKGGSREHHVHLMSQRPHVRFALGSDSPAELTIPFFYIHAMLPLKEDIISQYLDLRIESVTPPRTAIEDAGTGPTLSIYARMENVDVLGHSTQTYQGSAVVPEEPKSKPSLVLSNVARTAAVAGLLIPGLAPIAETVAGVAGGAAGIARAFGHSAPLEVGGAPYVPFPTAPTANANMDQSGRVLAYDVHQGVSLYPNIGGTGDEDPLVISSLCARRTIVNMGVVPSTSNGIASPWLTCCVTPAVGIQRLGRWFLSPCGMVSLFRRFWHGTMCYKIKLVTTGITGGKMVVMYNANSRGNPDDTHTLENIVWDLKASHELEFKIHWYSYRNLLRTFDERALSNPFTEQYDETRHNGSWSIATLQPVVGTRPGQNLDFIIESWMEDCRFAEPHYANMSARRVYNLPDINVDPEGDEPEPGFGGSLGTAGDSLAEIVDYASGRILGNLFPRPRDAVTGLFDMVLGRRKRKVVRRSGGVLGLNRVIDFVPITSQPSPSPVTTSQQPTFVPTLAASAAPSLGATFLPTRLSSSAPSVATTVATSSAPTVPECSVYMQQVDVEFLGGYSSMIRVGGIWKTAGTTLNIRSFAYSGPGEGALLRVLTSGPPSTLPSNGTAISGGFELSGPAGNNVDSLNGVITFATQVDILAVYVSVPGGSSVQELTPADMLGLSVGGTLGSDTVDGTNLSFMELGVGDTFTPPVQVLPTECATGSFTYACLLYTGELQGTTDSSRSGTFTTRAWGGDSLSFEAVANTRIYSGYVILAGMSTQGEVTESETVIYKEFGTPQPIHDDVMAVHVGEDLLSLRQDLKVFRENAEFTITSGEGSGSFQSHIHATGSGILGPYELLINAFAGVRGGVVAWYRLDGTGHAYIQRGQSYNTSGGNFDPDLQRGFEFVDTRINPTMVVSYPWYSQSRFEYARWNFAGNDANYRNVLAVNTGDSDLTVTESLRVKEDFDLIRFMGCPLLL